MGTDWLAAYIVLAPAGMLPVAGRAGSGCWARVAHLVCLDVLGRSQYARLAMLACLFGR